MKSLGKNLPQADARAGRYISRQAGYAKDYKAEFTQGEGEEQEYYDLHISLLTDAYTNPIGRVVVLHQITKLKQDQAELERARDQLEVVVSERTDELRRAIEQLQEELVAANTGGKTVRGCDRIGTRCDVRAGPIGQDPADQRHGRAAIRLPAG